MLGSVLAIAATEDESWLTVWLLVFVFIALPTLLLSLRDLLALVSPRWLGRRPLFLHICAAFGAGIGYGLGWMAVDSGHPQPHLHRLLVIVFPLIVYVTPLLLLLHGQAYDQFKAFYLGTRDEDGS